MKIFARLSVNQPVVKERVAALLAQADGVRWDVMFTKMAFYLGVIAGAGSLGVVLITVAGLVPGRGGVLLAGIGGTVAAVCTAAAALGPRMTQAAGICTLARNQNVPFIKVLPQILRVFKDAPQIVRQATADAEAQARKAEAERAAEQAQASHQALVSDVAKEVVGLIKTGSYQATAAGLVETGVLGGAETAALTKAAVTIEAEVVKSLTGFKS